MRRQLLVLVLVTLTMALTATTLAAGSGAMADFVFLLDKSGSVGSGNFQKMLDFVKDVSSSFELGACDVQVGVDTFSNSFNTEFTLGQFNNKNLFNAAVDRVKYTGGGTYTGPAITSMMGRSFTAAAGHRAGVPKIAIVVTDGRSSSRSATTAAAQKARAAGIHMLVVGVGSRVNHQELNAIASDPDSQNVYMAANFNALTSLKSLLATRACQQVQQQLSQTTTCSGTKADIVFVLDSSGSVGSSNFKRMLSFVNSLAKDWEVSQDNIRVGVETFSSGSHAEFHLNRYASKTDILRAINNTPYRNGGTNTGGALQYLRSTMFTRSHGDRPGVPNIGIVITDGKSNSGSSTATEAGEAKKAGITLFAVGVGAGVSQSELNLIASDPDSSHVFTVDDFSKMAAIKALFQAQACKAIPRSLPSSVPSDG